MLSLYLHKCTAEKSATGGIINLISKLWKLRLLWFAQGYNQQESDVVSKPRSFMFQFGALQISVAKNTKLSEHKILLTF